MDSDKFKELAIELRDLLEDALFETANEDPDFTEIYKRSDIAYEKCKSMGIGFGEDTA